MVPKIQMSKVVILGLIYFFSLGFCCSPVVSVVSVLSHSSYRYSQPFYLYDSCVLFLSCLESSSGRIIENHRNEGDNYES